MPRKCRILFTIPNFRTAGSQYVVLSLVQGLDKSRFEVFIAVEKNPELIPDVIPLSHKLRYQLTGKTAKDALGFSGLLKKHKIDLVHSWDYKSLAVEALGSRLACVKYLFTKKNAAWSKRWFLKSFLASHIAYDNPTMKNEFFNSHFLKHKITFIPHGVDTNVFRPLGLKEEENSIFKICCVGNINDNKNQKFIIDALKDLPVGIHLNIYGKAEPNYLRELKSKIAQLKLENRVHFHGYIENKHLPEILNQQDLFILASKKEGLPVSILEALACGLPVLSSDSGGGAKYIFKDNVVDSVFKIDDIENLKRLILTLSEDKVFYKRKSKESLDTIHKRFQLEREIKQYEQLYLGLS